MTIKQPEILSRQDFSEAVVRLRLNVSEIAKELGIPRTYLSEFRNGDRQLRPEHLAKLRDYFEAKGIEFTEEEEPAATAQGHEPDAVEQQTTDVILDPLAGREEVTRALLAVRHFAIDPKLTPDQISLVLDRMAENEQEVKNLLSEKVEEGLLSDWSESTEGYLREIFGKFGENYLLFRQLQGRPLIPVGEAVSYKDIKVLGDLVNHLFHESIQKIAEAIAAPATEEEPQLEEVAA